MKASELRIGNYILQGGKETIIDSLSRSIKDWDRTNNLRTIDVKPIQLTEEWLLKFGFNVGYKGNDYVNFWNKDKDVSIDVVDDEIFNYRLYKRVRTRSIIYVHQLQNLYFALTGKELQYETY